MSTLVSETPELALSADDFASLEERVLRTVELLKSERAARSEAEARARELHQSLELQTAELLRAEEELEAFKKEREMVRGRVERLLKQLDELTA